MGDARRWAGDEEGAYLHRNWQTRTNSSWFRSLPPLPPLCVENVSNKSATLSLQQQVRGAVTQSKTR